MPLVRSPAHAITVPLDAALPACARPTPAARRRTLGGRWIAALVCIAGAANLCLLYALFQAAPGLGCSSRAPCGHVAAHVPAP